MMIETEQERFEKFAKNKWAKNDSTHAALVVEKDSNGDYLSPMTQGAWIGWMAAIEDIRRF